MDSALEKQVRKTMCCMPELYKMPPSGPLHAWEWPHKPWYRLHIDYARPFMGHTYVIGLTGHL